MSSKKKKSKTMLEVAHEMAKGLYDAGIMNTITLREFDLLCLPPKGKFHISKNLK